MISLFSLVASAVAAVIAIVVWATGVCATVWRWAAAKHQPSPPPLDPDGEDADWGI